MPAATRYGSSSASVSTCRVVGVSHRPRLDQRLRARSGDGRARSALLEAEAVEGVEHGHPPVGGPGRAHPQDDDRLARVVQALVGLIPRVLDVRSGRSRIASATPPRVPVEERRAREPRQARADEREHDERRCNCGKRPDAAPPPGPEGADDQADEQGDAQPRPRDRELARGQRKRKRTEDDGRKRPGSDEPGQREREQPERDAGEQHRVQTRLGDRIEGQHDGREARDTLVHAVERIAEDGERMRERWLGTADPPAHGEQPDEQRAGEDPDSRASRQPRPRGRARAGRGRRRGRVSETGAV